MNDGYRADHERLAAKAGEFAGLAERAGAIHGELSTLVDSLGKSWGTDEIGQSFAAGYDGLSQQTRKGIEGMSGRLDDVGARLAAMARAYREGDEASAGGIEKAGS